MKRINLVLPAAGLGSRFQVVGELRPKPLIPVFDIPMIMWVILNFPKSSADKIWVVCQRKDELPSTLLPMLKKLSLDVGFIQIDGLTEGPASTVGIVLDKLNDSEAIIVANTDQFLFSSLEPFVESVRGETTQGQILTMKASSNAWSYVGRDSNGRVDRVVEKVVISEEATVGIYGWSKVSYAKAAFKDTFENNIRTNNEFYVAPTYNFMLEQGLLVETFQVGNHGQAVHGLGTPEDLRLFLMNEQARRVAINFQTMLNL